VWWITANYITSCRGAYNGAPVMVIHVSESMRLRRVSS
jgi:hypothetical protein